MKTVRGQDRNLDRVRHVVSYYSCLVAHYGPHGELLPACVMCGKCGAWLRPEEIDDFCPGHSATDSTGVSETPSLGSTPSGQIPPLSPPPDTRLKG